MQVKILSERRLYCIYCCLFPAVIKIRLAVNIASSQGVELNAERHNIQHANKSLIVLELKQIVQKVRHCQMEWNVKKGEGA